jgi:hypothetical protein
MTAIRNPASMKAPATACSGRRQYLSTARWPLKVFSSENS